MGHAPGLAFGYDVRRFRGMETMQKLLITLGMISSLALGLGGCSMDLFTVYKIDVQQGNALNEKDIARIRPGLTQRQVQFLIGNPLLQDPFHRDRWDYVYYYKPGYGEPQQARLTLFFDQGKVSRIERAGKFVDPDQFYLERSRNEVRKD